MFIDEVKIFVKAGTGGKGSNSMRREKYVALGGPAGGNGGRGGDVVLKATRHANTLASFYRNRHFEAGDGRPGGRNDRYGAYGEPLVLQVPLGTIVRDAETGSVMADLGAEDDAFVVARGGRGGRGSTALSRPHAVARYAERGEAGDERWIRLELRLLADVGLVGFPNVGKSTLISRVSSARPKIAPYPFTTVQPHLGVVRLDRDTSFVMADIPGLVEGAHEGKGMGDRFLKHIERTRLILHVVDASGWEQRDPVDDWRAVNRELAAWHPHLAAKPQMIAANKVDVGTAAANLKRLKRAAKVKIYPISAVTGEGVDELTRDLAAMLPTLPAAGLPELELTSLEALERPQVPLGVERDAGGVFVAHGTKLEKLVARTYLDNEHALRHLQSQLYKLGLDQLLDRAGALEGDVVRIGELEFTYVPGL
ncbi:MAG: GTPase ObgE [Candidatus Wallbacteria bacterium]|nr:GTPase ObgE [Candidatus Wallbacteria bacterium]